MNRPTLRVPGPSLVCLAITAVRPACTKLDAGSRLAADYPNDLVEGG
jgi:hypothetical protein